MVNFLRKLYLKWISSNRRIKLWFLPFTVSLKLTNKRKEELYFLMDKNYHYGFLIETIVLKLELMRETFLKQDYKFVEKDIETLDILITKGTELLNILEVEEIDSHLRSKLYLNRQKKFFDILNLYLPELFC